MAAALLSTGTSVLRGCPRISDVYLMEKILKYLGAETWWEGQDLYLDCSHADGTMIPECYSGKMRSSVILMGAMLGRSKKAQTGYPGGCVIGKRPVDLHIQVLRRLGAAVVENGGMIRASCGKLRGAEMFFQKRSVGATEQGILAAVQRGKQFLTAVPVNRKFIGFAIILPEWGQRSGFMKKAVSVLKEWRSLKLAMTAFHQTVLSPEPI